ncbi:MAG TPA: fibronectin type III domain-containing protein, partial [Gemmataceae bacterium]|nr:fibronectin type III domain-containing protein [Gemmataceae bacterium]
MPGCLPFRVRLLSLVALAICFASLLGAAPPPSAPASFLVQPYLQLPTPTSIRVMWETNQELPGAVEYGQTPELGQVLRVGVPSELHEVCLTDLKPGSRYYYRVRSGDLASEIYSFKTAPPPGTKRWRLALYGDSRSNPIVHRKIAEQIAKAKVDFILHTGDIVTNGKNHESWRREFFEPLGPVAHSVPWVSTIGNHERDSDNYFSYMALPGNERYFGFDFGNAHIVCLDSNGWIEKGRDSKQY